MTTGIPEWQMTVAALDAIDPADPAVDPLEAQESGEEILLGAVRPQIREAYIRLWGRVLQRFNEDYAADKRAAAARTLRSVGEAQ